MSHFECCLNRRFGVQKKWYKLSKLGEGERGGSHLKSKTATFFRETIPHINSIAHHLAFLTVKSKKCWYFTISSCRSFAEELFMERLHWLGWAFVRNFICEAKIVLWCSQCWRQERKFTVNDLSHILSLFLSVGNTPAYFQPQHKFQFNLHHNLLNIKQ